MSRAGGRVYRVGAVVGLLCWLAGFWVLGAGPAAAHASVLASIPADGAHADDDVSELIFDLNEPVALVTGSPALIDADGERLEISSASLQNDRLRLVLRPAGPVSDGAYLATARVVSPDTHVVSLSIRFTVGSVTEHAAVSAESVEPGAGWWAVPAAKALVYGGAVLTAGIVIVALTVWPALPARRRFWALYRLGAAVLAAGVTGRLILLMAARADGLGQITPEIAQEVVTTPFGAAGIIAALSTAAVALWAPGRTATPLFASGTTLVAVTLGGHGASLERWPFEFLATLLHVSAMVFWLGGVAVIALILGTVPRLGRWHRAVAVQLAVLVVTGVALAVFQVGYPAALITTGYGLVLLAKVAVAATAAGIGYVAYRALRGDGEVNPVAETVWQDESGPADPGPVRAAGGGAVATLNRPETVPTTTPSRPQRTWPVLGVECGLLLLAIAATSVLSSTIPAAETYDTRVSRTLDFGDGQLLDVTIDSIRRGSPELTVRLPGTPGSGAPAVDVELASAEANVARLPVDLTPIANGDTPGWRSEKLVVPAAGEWKVTVRFDGGTGPKLASFRYRVI